MSGKLQTVVVNLGERSYPIFIQPGIFTRGGKMIKQKLSPTRVALASDKHVAPLYAEGVLGSLEDAGFTARLIVVPAGERSKSLTRLKHVYRAFFDFQMDRKSAVVALGGGVVGDLAGFAAATFMRGIPLIQIPTSLLAQVDSSVGGKVAVDHPEGKNMIGAFYQPRLVLIDPDTLSTLPRPELRSGLAEVVKYGMILDREFFEFLERRVEQVLALKPADMTHVIRRCCQLKAQVVEKDEKESGLRAILNYGHTIAHALELLSGYRGLRHGEAVAIGMVGASLIAEEMGMVTAEVTTRQARLLKNFGLPTSLGELDTERLLQLLYHDKKVVGGKLRFILPRQVGEVVIADDVSEKVILRALRRLKGAA